MRAYAFIAFRLAIIDLVLDRRRHRIAHLSANKGPELGVLLREGGKRVREQMSAGRGAVEKQPTKKV